MMTLCTFLAACSSDAPLSPTPRTDADVAGAWRGTMRITSVTGEQCAAELQFLVGTSSEFRLIESKRRDVRVVEGARLESHSGQALRAAPKHRNA
jgi:hypothetical protein